MTDYHTHCLFGLDDGAETLEESVLLLETLKEQGADRVCLTPHFFPDADIERFLKVRNENYLLLK